MSRKRAPLSATVTQCDGTALIAISNRGGHTVKAAIGGVGVEPVIVQVGGNDIYYGSFSIKGEITVGVVGPNGENLFPPPDALGVVNR